MAFRNLADTRDRGALDLTDFTIAMYFIQGLITHQISIIPPTLPPGLYEQAGGSSTNTAPVIPQFTGSSGSFSPTRSTFANRGIQPQYTGQSQSLPPSLPARPTVRPNTLSQNDTQWEITPVEKAEADSFFDGLDTRKLGYIEGEIAVPFMLKSQLPGEELAQIWSVHEFPYRSLL
jgi:epidermal growth factor receptor substrate 15